MDIFSTAMQNGDLRIALQAMRIMLQAKALAIRSHSKNSIDLRTLPIEVLKEIIKNAGLAEDVNEEDPNQE